MGWEAQPLLLVDTVSLVRSHPLTPTRYHEQCPPHSAPGSSNPEPVSAGPHCRSSPIRSPASPSPTRTEPLVAMLSLSSGLWFVLAPLPGTLCTASPSLPSL